MRQEKKIEEILTNISLNQVKEYQHTDPINSVKLIQDKHKENIPRHIMIKWLESKIREHYESTQRKKAGYIQRTDD